MRSGVVLLREVTSEVAHYADRFESVRHRGLRQAFQALNPGLLICHPDTFHVRYANAAAREILGIGNQFPIRLPEALTMMRQEEFCETERRTIACYQTSIDNETHDVRAFPVYAQGSSNQVSAVLVVIREYNDVSWSLFEMLDRLPIAIAGVNGEDLRYINRRAIAEIYSTKGKHFAKRGAQPTAESLITGTLQGLLNQAPTSGDGRTQVQIGRARVDMHFSRLGEDHGARLIYWDPRNYEAPRLWH